MSSPYRDTGAPSADLSAQTTAAPLATFDVSGAKGADGMRGADGYAGGSTGADGGDAGHAGPAQPGESAGQIFLEMKADDAARAVKLTGELVLARGEKRRIEDLAVIDEAGVIVTLQDPALLALWDAHDWHGLFWRQRHAWLDGSIQLELFGHALLEHALNPDKLLVGKALVFQAAGNADARQLSTRCTEAIVDGRLLRDPLELRPLPLAGIPGWHVGNIDEAFHLATACYQPRRAGREYPPAYPDLS